MDIVTLAAALQQAMLYTDSVALHGVPIMFPTVNPTTQTWRFFDPTIPGYIETPYTAIGQTPAIGTNGNWWIGGADTDVPVNVQGENPQFQVVGRWLQYRFATQTPTTWTNLYELPQALTYTHTQTTASDVWNIQHNLGTLHLKAIFLDVNGKEFKGVFYDYANSTVNMLRVLVGDPIAGMAIIN